jgi:hypothetical protein
MSKKSIEVKVIKLVKIQADSGYEGIKKYHANSETPKKKSKKCQLREEDKADNRCIDSERINLLGRRLYPSSGQRLTLAKSPFVT